MNSGHPRYVELLDELKALHCKKAEDYGSGEDLLANLRASEKFGIPAWIGTMVRLNDKIHRISEYAKKGSLANEGVEDSFKDLASYALLALILWEETRSEAEAKGYHVTLDTRSLVTNPRRMGLARDGDAEEWP